MIKQVTDIQAFKQKALQWAATFDAVCYLDSNGFNDKYSKFDTLIAVGVRDEITADAGNAFDELEKFRQENSGWITGFFGYDLKNEIESLSSSNIEKLNFPDLYFFAPQYILIINGDDVEVIAEDATFVFNCIEQQEINIPAAVNGVKLQSQFNKKEYIDAVKKIQNHIVRGDIYVTNFCQEFFAEDAVINPVHIFSLLNQISPNPFASFFKWKDNYIICASPERFLAKRDSKLISQPIKGTARRGGNEAEDEALKHELRSQAKELQENVMIVDLVRNDLTRSAKAGTVRTEELYEIQSFKQVHQMVSTVACDLSEGISVVEAIKNTFPMGSMTGAPKFNAMQLMERYERSKRGVYSGAIGYFSPDNDFDFNVVIRSLLYNAKKKYLAFQVGSAITYHANPEKEYDECLLKSKAIMEVLGQPEFSGPSAHR